MIPMPLLDPYFNNRNENEEEIKEEDIETHNL